MDKVKDTQTQEEKVEKVEDAQQEEEIIEEVEKDEKVKDNKTFNQEELEAIIKARIERTNNSYESQIQKLQEEHNKSLEELNNRLESMESEKLFISKGIDLDKKNQVSALLKTIEGENTEEKLEKLVKEFPQLTTNNVGVSKEEEKIITTGNIIKNTDTSYDDTIETISRNLGIPKELLK